MSGSKGGTNRPRDERAKQPSPMREGANDRQIVQWVHTYRVLSQAQIEHLLGRSRSTVQRLLRRLYDHRYLDRIYLPIVYHGSSPALYILDRQGIDLLRRMGVKEVTGIPNKRRSGKFWAHALAISDVNIALAQACAAKGWAITTWRTETDIKSDYDRVRVPGGHRPLPLVPDGYFNLHIPDRGVAHFFLELDRGTMPLSSFKAKLEAYVAYQRTGGFTRRYEGKRFRVLTVVDGVGEGRVKNLLELSANVRGTGRQFWFTHLERLTSESVLQERIWHVVGETQPVSLFGSGLGEG